MTQSATLRNHPLLCSCFNNAPKLSAFESAQDESFHSQAKDWKGHERPPQFVAMLSHNLAITGMLFSHLIQFNRFSIGKAQINKTLDFFSNHFESLTTPQLHPANKECSAPTSQPQEF